MLFGNYIDVDGWEGILVFALLLKKVCCLTVLQVFAEFNRIATTNLQNEFYDGLDRYTPRLVTIFKSKKGSIGETLAEFVQQIDPGVSILQEGMERYENFMSQLSCPT